MIILNVNKQEDIKKIFVYHGHNTQAIYKTNHLNFFFKGISISK
mgnify:CR=1 FL=1